ncbi:unnamed protein product, partial [Iphiclides podalirius]
MGITRKRLSLSPRSRSKPPSRRTCKRSYGQIYGQVLLSPPHRDPLKELLDDSRPTLDCWDTARAPVWIIRARLQRAFPHLRLISPPGPFRLGLC